MTTHTIVPDEAAHFGRLAADWWNPKGSSAMLHRLNPVRLSYVRAQVNAHFGCDPAARHPLAGKTALDAGCGAGLLCEPLARLGATVTGIDAAPESINVASAHAAAQRLSIDYICGEIGALTDQFDLITSMEVIEHVADPAAFVGALADRLAPDGIMILSTPNQTALSRLMMIDLAEGLGQVPRGTHDWDKFVPPDALETMLVAAGLQITGRQGIGYSPAKGLHLSNRLDLDYLMTAVRA